MKKVDNNGKGKISQKGEEIKILKNQHQKKESLPKASQQEQQQQ